MTFGIVCLVHKIIILIFGAVRTYDQLDVKIGPYEEDDMGQLNVSGKNCYWKIDHYNWNLKFHSTDLVNPCASDKAR